MAGEPPHSAAARHDLDPYSYDGFRRSAVDETRSAYERIGFPDAYRAGREAAILADMRSKVTNLERFRASVLDVGSGCSPLAVALMAHARVRDQRLVMVDSPEMLDQLPPDAPATLLPGRFPLDHSDFLRAEARTFDAVIVYSVIQYVAAEASAEDFLDAAVSLLAPGGQLLIGDIPNESMRSRFLSSAAGREFARPRRQGKIDDAMILGMLGRYRAAGFHTFVLPQGPELPMANRREDVLIVRP